MPCCKNCGARLSKFDKDMCPICGCKNPLEGVNSETIDITKQINVDETILKTYHPCKRMTAFILSLLIGWTGAQFFYLKYSKIALIYLACHLVFLGGLITILLFAANAGLFLSFFLPFIIVYLLNLGVGVYFLIKTNFKDGCGELIK